MDLDEGRLRLLSHSMYCDVKVHVCVELGEISPHLKQFFNEVVSL